MQLPNVRVLYEDQDLTIIDKPSGIVVNKSSTVKEPTIEDWFAAYQASRKPLSQDAWKSLVPADFEEEYGTPQTIYAQRGGVVHRLDKETSGVLVLANHPGALVGMLQQFKQRAVQKEYVCLVHGKFQLLEGALDLPLARATHNRTKFAVDVDGRTAKTAYAVAWWSPGLSESAAADIQKKTADPSLLPRHLAKTLVQAYQGFSFIHCWPHTGRTHQIRVHFASVSHTLVSDATYLGKKRASIDALWCPRLFLHAQSLTMTHPRTGQKMTIEAPLHDDLVQTLHTFLPEAERQVGVSIPEQSYA